MSQNIENKMNEKTVLVVFPSIFSLNKIDRLKTNISNILQIKKQSFTSIRKNESLLIIETSDPVLVSSTISSLFGIDRTAIAKEVENNFERVLATITDTSMNLLLKGDKFLLKVEGRSSRYIAKDLEVTSTAALIEKSVGLQAKVGTEADHNRLLYTYLTESHAYVCIFVDKGMGGIPYNSQQRTTLCCIYNELSAIACLQSIKLGFDINMVICYSDDSDLLKITKMINRMLASIVQKKIQLQFCKIPKIQDQLIKILMITYLTSYIAHSKKIKRVTLSLLPVALPVWFVEQNAKIVFEKQLIPWIPLAGMDSSILENSRQLGLEKYFSNLENLCKSKFPKKNISNKIIQNSAKMALKSLRSISVTVGPKNLYDMIDSLRTNH